MYILITYDVVTEDKAGQRRLRRVAVLVKTSGREYRIPCLNARSLRPNWLTSGASCLKLLIRTATASGFTTWGPIGITKSNN